MRYESVGNSQLDSACLTSDFDSGVAKKPADKEVMGDCSDVILGDTSTGVPLATPGPSPFRARAKVAQTSAPHIG